MSDLASVQLMIYGHVQGVFFRAFTAERARKLSLTGYVSNLPEGAVKVQAEGERNKLEALISYLEMGPPGARVTKVVTKWSEYSGSYSRFNIRY